MMPGAQASYGVGGGSEADDVMPYSAEALMKLQEAMKGQ